MLKIGICTGYLGEDGRERYTVALNYINAVYRCGGIPIGLFPFEGQQTIVGELDGILLTGGNDIFPHFMGEEPLPLLGDYYIPRDIFELGVVKEAIEKRIPILGICRGMQVMNVAMGGTLYQDLSYKGGEKLMHRQNSAMSSPCHRVKLTTGSIAWEIFGSDTVVVNSYHHQAVKDVAPSFESTGYSEDGIIEFIEYKGNSFAVGVQWHPECMVDKDISQLKVFERLIEEAKKVRR